MKKRQWNKLIRKEICPVHKVEPVLLSRETESGKFKVTGVSCDYCEGRMRYLR